MSVRTTDTRTVGHRRLVTRTLITALRNVFGDDYDRDRQGKNIKITPDFPFKREQYPCVVVEYSPTRNVNAGVGHEEWFIDAAGQLRKWHHRRFEGNVTFNIMTLSTVDRDIWADAVEEVMTMGSLDDALVEFFYTIYGHPDDPVELVFSQLMLNVDEISGGGNSASIAPWSPEDTLVHETSLSVEVHGGIYNVVPTQEWGYVTKATAESYPQFEETVVLPFNEPALDWTNPFEFEDDAVVTGSAVISGDEELA